MRATPQAFEVRNAFRSFSLPWEEIERFGFGWAGGLISLGYVKPWGRRKRLLSGIRRWTSTKSDPLVNELNRRLADYGEAMGKKLPPDQLALYQRIDEILWEDWDPIGVGDIVEARDEYQNYLPGIFALALKPCDVDEIADRLHLIERRAMDLRGNRDHCTWVARKIRDERIQILGPV